MRVLVCGTGHSVREGFLPPAGVLTVGVNDIDRYFPVDHLLVIDRPRDFSQERQEVIRNSRSGVFWSCHDWPNCAHPDRRRLEVVGLVEWTGDLFGGPYPGRYTSVYPAVHFAVRQGGRDIGIIGCDLQDHQELTDLRVAIAQQFDHLRKLYDRQGIRLVNLSPLENRLRLPQMDLESWLSSEPATQP